MTFVEKMYLDGLGNNLQTEKGLNAMRKHALALVPHNDFNNLVRYTLKEGLTPGRTPVISKLPQELIFYVPEQYCAHCEVTIYCSICYKQEILEFADPIPPKKYEKLFERFPNDRKKWIAENKIIF